MQRTYQFLQYEIRSDIFCVSFQYPDIPVQQIELRRLQRPIDFAPVNLRLARRLADNELVIGRAAGMLAGPARQGTVGGNYPFVAAHRFLEQGSRGEIPLHAIGMNAVAFEPSSAVNLGAHQDSLRHEGPAT